MTLSTINRFVATFELAFRQLGASVPMDVVEWLSMLVHTAMEAKTRAYHTSEHVFALCEGANARQTLAALFHDVVYFQLDGGFPAPTTALLQTVVRGEGDGLVLQPLTSLDGAYALCADVFGFVPGQVLALYGGLNEFLSAVVAADALLQLLGQDDLLAVIACIEATIPFRKADAQGRSATDALAARLRALYLRGHTAQQAVDVDAFLDRTLGEAIDLANRDVGGFAAPDPGLFLASTWLLIEESNAPRIVPHRYTTQEYRLGLTRMEGFLRQLDPHCIFQQYRGYPTAAAMATHVEAATRNMAFACDFLEAKIVAIAVVEALVLGTGPDVPISMFLGDIRSAQGRPDRAEDYLPVVPAVVPLDDALLRVFEKGRSQESRNDLTASPLTAFMYRSLGQAGMREALSHAWRLFEGQLLHRDFLRLLDAKMVRAVALACSRIALSRRAALEAFAQSL